MKLNFTTFKGVAPRISPRLLPADIAQIAADTKLWSGELRPINGDRFVGGVPLSTQAVYKYKKVTGESVWLSWNTPVKIVKSPTVDDAQNKLYISNVSGQPPLVTDSSRIAASATTVDASNAFTVALPTTTGLLMTVTGSGTVNKESRSYAISYVRMWPDSQLDVGKMSDPAKTTSGNLTVDVNTGQSVVLSNIDNPSTAAAAGVTDVFVYRSSVTTTGQVLYRYVDRFKLNPSATGNPKAVYEGGKFKYTDSTETINIGEEAVSLYWDAPDKDLKGLTSLNNGVLAAFKGNDVYFSVNYQPHAWPAEYRVAVDSKIIGLGAFGNSVVVCTDAYPVIITVQDPANPSVRPIQANYPCLSAESIVNYGGGVIYGTTDGLVLINSTQPTLVTKALITKDEWMPLNPHTLRAAYYRDAYVGIFTSPKSVQGFILDLSEMNTGFVWLYGVTNAIWTDVENTELYLVKPGEVFSNLSVFDGSVDTKRVFKWKSKVNVSSQGVFNLSAARVDFTSAHMPPKEPDIDLRFMLETPVNADAFNSVPFNGYLGKYEYNVPYSIIFNYYVDGNLKLYYPVLFNTAFRLPAGFVGDTVEVEIISDIPIHSIQLASSIGELTYAQTQ